MLGDVMEEIAPVLKKRKSRFVLVSMLAAYTCERISEAAGGDYPVIRIMPNTPVSVGEGMILYSPNRKVTEDEISFFLGAFEKAGRFSPLAEKLMDAGASVAGCGPAFVDMFIAKPLRTAALPADFREHRPSNLPPRWRRVPQGLFSKAKNTRNSSRTKSVPRVEQPFRACGHSKTEASVPP